MSCPTVDKDGLRTPRGFRRLDVRVYFNGDQIVITGEPSENEEAHSCDQCGCGWEHILANAVLDHHWCDQLKHLLENP